MSAEVIFKSLHRSEVPGSAFSAHMDLSPGYVRKLESISAVFLLYLSREAVEHNPYGL